MTCSNACFPCSQGGNLSNLVFSELQFRKKKTFKIDRNIIFSTPSLLTILSQMFKKKSKIQLKIIFKNVKNMLVVSIRILALKFQCNSNVPCTEKTSP